MQPSDVTLYGRDYSAREYTDEQFQRYMNAFPHEPRIDFLGRYIGYPTNKKCVSYYPGMYQHHLKAGRPSFFFHQIGYGDMEGGYAAGRQHAIVAFTDATSSRVQWNGESHIVACMDRFYAKPGYRTLGPADLREYMRGFRSILGDRAGFYGFYDSMRDAIREGWASFYVQCGARSAHVPGIHAWQENNRQPTIIDAATDILELYCTPEYAFGKSTSVLEEGEGMYLAKGDGNDAAYMVDITTFGRCKDHIETTDELAALEALLGQKTRTVPQAWLDRIPDVAHGQSAFGAAVWNHKIPKSLAEAPEFTEAFTLAAAIYAGVKSGALADVDEAALATELKKAGVAGISAAELKAVLANVKLVPGA